MSTKTTTIIGIIFALAAFRLMQFIPNVSPIAAMALFAGAQFTDKKLAFVVPFAALLISDLILGMHSTMLFVYAAFALTVVAGLYISKRQNIVTIAIAAVGTSFLFFLITNAGAWMMYDTYSAGITGLMESYIAGIPFYQNTLMGDLFFNAVLFGGYALITQKNQTTATNA